ncbi:alpha/beta hydrolase [Sphingomonas sp.]|uniref:alpha/beta hydrolase n=1 Tax=Sphingomonas sp. TaxID=28214 RepID=UPI003CC6ABE3
MRWLLALLLALAWGGAARAEDTGRFVEIAAVPTTRIAPPHVVVWLPPGYDAGRSRYPVVYMHDGQNVFFPARSGFNKVWAADRAVLRLIAAHRIALVIVVAIDHPGAARYRQYFPQRVYEMGSPALRRAFDAQVHGPITGDAYLAFLVHDLKPLIDRSYRTRADAAHTAIVGSSMGGLISCYGFVEYPRVFGRAACVSTHWLLAMPSELPADADVLGLWGQYLMAHLGAPAGRRLWMDHGTLTLDANYGPWQEAIDADLTTLGWRRGRDFESSVYPGAAHEENAWAARLDDIFAWLFG